LFAAVDTLDADRVAPFIADDVCFRFGNAEPINGKAGFLAASRDFVTSIAGLRHEITDLWEPAPDTAIAELQVQYRRHDEAQLTLPCCNIFRLRDGLVCDYRIYMDINPVYAVD
jgi:ketosteroid isomerase-like protein